MYLLHLPVEDGLCQILRNELQYFLARLQSQGSIIKGLGICGKAFSIFSKALGILGKALGIF